MAAEQLAAMTGLPLAEAGQYLEMAGGNLEAAVSLYFDMGAGDGGGDDGFATAANDVPAEMDAPSVAHTLMFGSEPAPPSWSGQGFEFSPEPSMASCILQHKNGPCGVLAVINAVVIAQAGCPLPCTVVDDDMLARALAEVLVRCATVGRDGAAPTKVIVADWADGTVGGAHSETEIEPTGAAVMAHLRPRMGAFRGAGGVNLLCLSAVLTRGPEQVRSEMSLDGGSPPLVSGLHALCATELLGLLMVGIARGNVCAYGNDGAKVAWRQPSDVGLLSRDEIDMGRPLADELKGPRKPVYVLHGGDHFTLLWAPGGSAASIDGKVDFVHWNGLPPNRALVRLRLRNCSLEQPPPAPPQHVPTHWRMRVGEVESIVQALPADKQARPGCWRTHSYEFALATQAVVDDDSSEERPAHVPAPPCFEQGQAPAEGQAWRCASCYQSRFKTMCFGENPAPASRTCKFCGKSQAEAGWTLWRRFAEMPPSLQRRIDRTSGPKILSVLGTRWPDAEIFLFDSTGGEVALGGEGFDPAKYVTPST